MQRDKARIVRKRMLEGCYEVMVSSSARVSSRWSSKVCEGGRQTMRQASALVTNSYTRDPFSKS